MQRPHRSNPASSARPHRATHLAVVGRDQLLVPRVLLPRNIPLVPVPQQHRPFFRAGLADAAPHALAPVLDHRLLTPPPEGVGTRIDRIRQQRVEAGVGRQLPDNPLALVPHRDLDALPQEPQVDLPHAAQFGELAEHQRERVPLALVRAHLDMPAVHLLVAGRQGGEQFAAGGQFHAALQRALAEHRQLHLAEPPLHPQVQPVVGPPGIVQPVAVPDQAAHDRAEVQQRVPVAPVARQPGGFQREHQPSPSPANRREQAVKARPLHAAAGGALVLVDHFHLAEAQFARMVGQPVLQLLALDMVAHLEVGRLAHVDEGLALQVVRGERPALRRSHAGLLRAGWAVGAAPLRSVPPRPAGRPAAAPAPAGPGAGGRTGSAAGPGVCDGSWGSPSAAGNGSSRQLDTSSRRSASAARDRRGTARTAHCDASGAVIHSGM